MNSTETLANAAALRPTAWLNPGLVPYKDAAAPIPPARIEDAAQRLARFAPYIAQQFPETAENGGLIESPLRGIGAMQAALCQNGGHGFPGRLLLKMDSHLPIAGSVKARGGIYEILKHAETLALQNGVLHERNDYRRLATPEAVRFFSGYKVQVGSTGNLGLSIGIISAKLGFGVVVHMSAEAKQWKKDLLRSRGVTVLEYEGDYSRAVEEGRARSDADPTSYFVDDEHSEDLFLGYAVAARRVAAQLAAAHVAVDKTHPLFVYIPCGVGGAPGGITYGLKQLYGDAVHCFFAEPTHAPCMLLGLASGQCEEVAVQDFGIDGRTLADGLAVGRPSGLVCRAMRPLLSGAFTCTDADMLHWMRTLYKTEGIFVEPSACAAFAAGPFPGAMARYCTGQRLSEEAMQNATHIAWATGGSMVPGDVRAGYLTPQ